MSNLELIKQLRALTAAGMQDCKNALEETNWNLDQAIDLVKIKGLNIVSERSGKVASEGLVQLSHNGPCKATALIEINSQTDFVANNPSFVSFVKDAAKMVYDKGINYGTVVVSDFEQERQKLVSTFKEQISVRRWWFVEALQPTSKVFTYLHSNNKIGVILTLFASSEEICNSEEFNSLGNDLAMQIAAMSPLAVSSDLIDADVLSRQTNIFQTQIHEMNKPVAAHAKILEGKLNKWYGEVCLLKQESIVVSKQTVEQVIKNVSDKLNGTIQVSNFIRAEVGEGLEVVQENLADEITKMTATK